MLSIFKIYAFYSRLVQFADGDAQLRRPPQPVDVTCGASESLIIHLVCESTQQIVLKGDKPCTAILERPLKTVSACVSVVCVENRVAFLSLVEYTREI